jgi:hypothetical protein
LLLAIKLFIFREIHEIAIFDRFISHVKNKNYPVIRLEIYYAKSVGETYDFFGKSYSGIIAIDDFKTAIREGYVSLVADK